MPSASPAVNHGRLADADPGDPRIATLAADLAAHLPEEMAAVMVANLDSIPDHLRPPGSGPVEETEGRWWVETTYAEVSNESGMVTVANGRLGVAVSSQTNVIVELTEPITVIRPLGRRAEATTIRFFADTPGTALNALRPLQPRDTP
jgi:hypothetical protein